MFVSQNGAAAANLPKRREERSGLAMPLAILAIWVETVEEARQGKSPLRAPAFIGSPIYFVPSNVFRFSGIKFLNPTKHYLEGADKRLTERFSLGKIEANLMGIAICYGVAVQLARPIGLVF